MGLRLFKYFTFSVQGSTLDVFGSDKENNVKFNGRNLLNDFQMTSK